MLPFRNPKTKFLMPFAALLVLTAGTLVRSQDKPSVYVRHWEQFHYPPIASATRSQGTVKLKLKIAPDGRVIDAISLSDEGTPKPNELLLMASIAIVKTWTFGCFNCAVGAGYEHIFTFVYKLEGAPRYYRPTEIVMDLPNEVTVTSTPMECDHCPPAAPGVSLIDPHGVGILVGLTATRESLQTGRPPATLKDYTDSYPDCKPRTEITWPELDGGGNVSAFLRNDSVFQIESSTRRYSTIEGITVNSSSTEVKRHYKGLEAYVLDPSGGKESDFHDLNYWISRKDGMAFELAYSPTKRRRFVSRVIVFDPDTEFFPEGCIPPSQRWISAPPYTFFDK
jgi:hypothetical protein